MEMFIMIFIVTILLDVYMMVNDDYFPYNQAIADRISKVVGVVVWVLAFFYGVSSSKIHRGNTFATKTLRDKTERTSPKVPKSRLHIRSTTTDGTRA